jgi:hypothetical protein
MYFLILSWKEDFILERGFHPGKRISSWKEGVIMDPLLFK